MHPGKLTAGTQELLVCVDVSPFSNGVFSGFICYLVFGGCNAWKTPLHKTNSSRLTRLTRTTLTISCILLRNDFLICQ